MQVVILLLILRSFNTCRLSHKVICKFEKHLPFPLSERYFRKMYQNIMFLHTHRGNQSPLPPVCPNLPPIPNRSEHYNFVVN